MNLLEEIQPWTGQEIFIWDGMLVYAEHISYIEESVALAEFPHNPHGDRYIIDLDDFYKLESAPPEMIP